MHIFKIFIIFIVVVFLNNINLTASTIQNDTSIFFSSLTDNIKSDCSFDVYNNGNIFTKASVKFNFIGYDLNPYPVGSSYYDNNILKIGANYNKQNNKVQPTIELLNLNTSFWNAIPLNFRFLNYNSSLYRASNIEYFNIGFGLGTDFSDIVSFGLRKQDLDSNRQFYGTLLMNFGKTRYKLNEKLKDLPEEYKGWKNSGTGGIKLTINRYLSNRMLFNGQILIYSTGNDGLNYTETTSKVGLEYLLFSNYFNQKLTFSLNFCYSTLEITKPNSEKKGFYQYDIYYKTVTRGLSTNLVFKL